MPTLMRCLYCGILQDEPQGAKLCSVCGGELAYTSPPPADEKDSYIEVQMELDQVMAPAGQNIERHILVSLIAPKQVPVAQAAQTKSGRPPINFCAVLDNSGSMQGEKLVQAKQAVRQALSRLWDGDVLSLVIFNSDVRCVLEPTEIKAQTRKVVESALQEINATGMTALCAGLEAGIAKALEKKLASSLVLLLSDGQANVGETDLEKIGQRGVQARKQGLVVSTLGIGADYNEALMAEIATQGGGRFYHLQQAEQISAYLNGELGEIANLAGREVKIHLKVPDGVVVVPLSAAYPIQQQAGQVTLSVGELPCDTELEIPLRVALSAQAAETRLRFEGWVEYLSPIGSRLKSSLNRVTLRFVSQPSFQLSDGAVKPVVERVMEHFKAVSVLGISRASYRSDVEGARTAEQAMQNLRQYARLLGDERAEKEMHEFETEYDTMRRSSLSFKQAVSQSYARHRGAKKFSKDD